MRPAHRIASCEPVPPSATKRVGCGCIVTAPPELGPRQIFLGPDSEFSYRAGFPALGFLGEFRGMTFFRAYSGSKYGSNCAPAGCTTRCGMRLYSKKHCPQCAPGHVVVGETNRQIPTRFRYGEYLGCGTIFTPEYLSGGMIHFHDWQIDLRKID